LDLRLTDMIENLRALRAERVPKPLWVWGLRTPLVPARGQTFVKEQQEGAFVAARNEPVPRVKVTAPKGLTA
jgi:hypothetical protein